MRIRAIAPALVSLAALVGLALGVARGARYWGDGFPLLMLDEVRRLLAISLLAVFLFLGLLALLGRGLGARWMALGAALAGLPLLLLAGYQANRAWGIRPTELLTVYALRRNLLLVSLGIVVWLLIVFLLRRAENRAQEGFEEQRLWWRGPLLWSGFVLLLYGGVAAALSYPAPGSPQPPMLVLLVDALRPDRLSSYGNSRATSPAIDSLAKDGVLFRQAITASTFTKSSVASIFTGRYPFQHGVYWGSHQDSSGAVSSDLLAEGETTLAEVLQRHDYLTESWVQNSHLRGSFGFDQGFVDYRDQQGSAVRIHRLLTRWLGGPGRRYGFFGYVHYIDLHDPYQPKAPYDSIFGPVGDPYQGIDLSQWGAYLDAVRRGEIKPSAAQVDAFLKLYDGQIRFVDDRIGELLATLKRLGLYDRMLIVLLADHGDGFMEHGFISHSTTPYDELARVPLIVKFPGGRFAGRQVDEQVRLVDLVPTLLEVARVREPLELAGCSLMPLVDPASRSPRGPECGQALIEIAEEGAAPIVAVRDGRYKYIWHEKKRHELYDLAADSGETANLIDAIPPAAEGLKRRAELAVTARALREKAGQVELDDKTIRELKALGYLK